MIGDHEATGAEEVQRLVDPAVVIEAVIIPALPVELIKKSVHRVSCQWTIVA
jgi:hypothetical protein